MKSRITDVPLLEKKVRPNLRIEKLDWEPPFLRIYDGDSYLVELWEPDLLRMIGELKCLPLIVATE